MPLCVSADSKVNPENKGTESDHDGRRRSDHIEIARLIPKTRELKVGVVELERDIAAHIARLIPKTRELKDDQHQEHRGYPVHSKVNPENKGTERNPKPGSLPSRDHPYSKVNPENKGTESAVGSIGRGTKGRE